MSINIELLNEIKNRDINDTKIIDKLNHYVADPNLYEALIELEKQIGSSIDIANYSNLKIYLKIYPKIKSVKIEILKPNDFVKSSYLGCFKYNYDTKKFELEPAGEKIEKHANLMEINSLFLNYNQDFIYNEINNQLKKLV